MLLPERQRRKLLLLVGVQLFLGGLDLIAVGLAGLLGTLAVAGVQSQSIGHGTIGRVMTALHLDGLAPQTQVAALALITTALFLGRTAASIYLIRRALHFLGVRAAEASSELVGRLLAQPLTYLQTRSVQEFLFGVTTSASALVLGALGTLVVMAADASMLLALAVLMLYVSPIVAMLAGAMLGVIVVILHRLTTAKAHALGTAGAALDVQGRDLLVEALSTYRDMRVRRSEAYYAGAIRDVRLRSAAISAESTFLPNVSKYVLESAVILGALVIGAAEFALENAEKAVGVLALFLAAGTRLAPAIIRLQQGAIALRNNLGQGVPALHLLDELAPGGALGQEVTTFAADHVGFEPDVQVDGVSYRYPGGARDAVTELSIGITSGQLIALVGPSGAGKSTAADLLLGVLEPDVGSVRISGMSPRDAVLQWPGAIAYVPQDVWIADGSVRKNVALGFDLAEVPDVAIWKALEAAHLADVVRFLPDGLDAVVGERGAKLSGGQRQRLGIARALLTEPKLLVLDEATSALDADTEHQISASIHALHGSVSVIVIAHRLAIVRGADQVLYFSQGRAIARGDFASVRAQVQDFDRQAQLLGL